MLQGVLYPRKLPQGRYLERGKIRMGESLEVAWEISALPNYPPSGSPKMGVLWPFDKASPKMGVLWPFDKAFQFIFNSTF